MDSRVKEILLSGVTVAGFLLSVPALASEIRPVADSEKPSVQVSSSAEQTQISTSLQNKKCTCSVCP